MTSATSSSWFHSSRTHHVDPGPPTSIVAKVFAKEDCHERRYQHHGHETPEDAQHRSANSLRPPHRESPYARKELRVYDDAHGRAVCCEQEVIEAYCCLWGVGMSIGVLRADRGRIEERCGGNGIAAKSEDIQGGKVYGETERGFAQVVGNGLWVEGSAPGDKRS